MTRLRPSGFGAAGAQDERVRAIADMGFTERQARFLVLVIVDALGRGRNAVAIWQDLVDDHGFAARYASVRRFVVQLRGATPPEARVVITTAAGEEGQVDYGAPSISVRVRLACAASSASSRSPRSMASRSSRTPRRRPSTSAS